MTLAGHTGLECPAESPVWKLQGRGGQEAGSDTKPCPQLREDNVNSGFVDSAAKQASAHVEQRTSEVS